MEPTRLTGQGIRDLNDRGPKKKPAPAEAPASEASGEQPIAAAAPAPEAASAANDAPAAPTPVTEAATTERHDG